MLFPTLVLKQFPAKLTLAKATRQKVDFAIADQILDQVQSAITEALEQKELSIQEQIEQINEKFNSATDAANKQSMSKQDINPKNKPK